MKVSILETKLNPDLLNSVLIVYLGAVYLLGVGLLLPHSW